MSDSSLFLPNISDGEDKSSQLKNRIRKNYQHIKKWAKRTVTNCFRIYDRDIKEWPLVIDYYDGRYCVQYFSSDRDNDDASEELKNEINTILSSLLQANPNQIYWRSRIKRKKTEQYEKISAQKDFFTVLEYGVKFKINLLDYLDTGLFLDHRETRQQVAKLCKHKRLLNLFAYTCSFSVHAAIQGASHTTSIDLSNTYTEWGRDNFELNQLPEENNIIIRADCLKFLANDVAANSCYDVIVIDPPTISRSKKMDEIFDIQRDYQSLLTHALKLLSPQGVIFFSTNSRKFHFDQTLFPECTIEDISSKTIPLDFHQKKIHYCWKLTPAIVP